MLILFTMNYDENFKILIVPVCMCLSVCVCVFAFFCFVFAIVIGRPVHSFCSFAFVQSSIHSFGICLFSLFVLYALFYCGFINYWIKLNNINLFELFIILLSGEMILYASVYV